MRLAAGGSFGDARTELIGGDIIVMNPEYRPHSWVKDELHYRLRRALEELDSDISVSSGSIQLSDHDMPLPDIVLNRAPKGEGAIPLAAVVLVVEISSTTVSHDRNRKMRLYAEAGIPEYWLADLGRRVLHQLWAPVGDAFTERREIPFGEQIAAATINGLTVEAIGL